MSAIAKRPVDPRGRLDLLFLRLVEHFTSGVTVCAPSLGLPPVEVWPVIEEPARELAKYLKLGRNDRRRLIRAFDSAGVRPK